MPPLILLTLSKIWLGVQTKICNKRAIFDYTSIILQQNASDTRSLIDQWNKKKSCKKIGAHFVDSGRTMGRIVVKIADVAFDVENQVCSLQT